MDMESIKGSLDTAAQNCLDAETVDSLKKICYYCASAPELAGAGTEADGGMLQSASRNISQLAQQVCDTQHRGMPGREGGGMEGGVCDSTP